MSKGLYDHKIAVLAGGIGSERQVSLQSGNNIFKAVSRAGFNVIQSDISPDDLSILDDNTIDVFFLALHGIFGEDGRLQQILEERNLKFTGSGAGASRLAFNKQASKEAFKKAGALVANDVYITQTGQLENLSGRLSTIGDKFVIKPISEGSSVGVEIVDGVEAAERAARKCFGDFSECMVEQFIEGKEITVGILNGRALPIIEIVSKAEFYDYSSKYLDDATEYLFDTVKEKSIIERIQGSAVDCYNSLGCRHQSRVDMILTGDGRPYVLEINTLPGFTSHSLLPMAAAKAGISPEQLCSEIIKSAIDQA